ncbi:ABC transporter substrate-binding protein [Marinicrinis lubricantis]|uniref:ABC transporter substrate-binding protein n=1 Tax=Marinicrinis lubricantis TaxID=2086470 RepID=A0ABW1IL91_9BACL
MKRGLIIMMVCFLTVFLAACGGGNTNNANNAGNSANQPVNGTANEGQDETVYKVGVAQLLEHPSLDSSREGFIQALKDAGIEEGVNLELDYQNAQNDPTMSATIAQKFAGQDLDLVLGIATPIAQALKQQVKETPVLFTSVTDPLGAGLVENLEQPESNVTGMSDTHPEEIEEMMKFISEQFPEIKTIGVIINQSEQNSLVAVERAEKELEALGIKLERANITNSSEVKQAADSLAGKVDAFFTTKDNTVISALEAIVQVANDKDIPIFTNEKDSLARGGVATFSVDYFEIGYATGEMAVEILKNGKAPSEVPVQFPENLDLVVNLKYAKEQGVEFSDELLQTLKPENIIE